MANISQAAGNNGVSGASAVDGAYTGALGATYGDADSLAVSNSNAVRRSVCQSGGTVSTVWSETAGFRTAYAGVEVDLPTLTATRTGA
jgi:hypothetical protein